MSKKLACDLSIEFVPLPPEQRAAWEYAMQIMSRLIEQARLQTCSQSDGSEVGADRMAPTA